MRLQKTYPSTQFEVFTKKSVMRDNGENGVKINFKFFLFYCKFQFLFFIVVFVEVPSLTAKQRNSETAKQRNSETAKQGNLYLDKLSFKIPRLLFQSLILFLLGFCKTVTSSSDNVIMIDKRGELRNPSDTKHSIIEGDGVEKYFALFL
jgi:hypothetical protein